MIVKGTTDFIRLFMLKNHIEYLDGDGWNETFYHELDEDERELAMDLTPIYEYLLQYVGDSNLYMEIYNCGVEVWAEEWREVGIAADIAEEYFIDSAVKRIEE